MIGLEGINEIKIEIVRFLILSYDQGVIFANYIQFFNNINKKETPGVTNCDQIT